MAPQLSPLAESSAFEAPAWLSIARAEIGTTERPGLKDNEARILEYLATCGRFTDDETPWCSAFANWCVGRAGLAGTHKANARSWLEWGTSLTAPKLGCITVLWREARSSAKGHVGFFLENDKSGVRLLGGNQNNAVSILSYPHERVLGYRWPSGL